MVTIKYKKTAAAVYISHIDIYRAIYRGIRRANLDVAYSKGYNPHAELFLSPPLPLFAHSDCEYFTADTREDADEFFIKYSASAHDLLPPVSRFYTAKNPNLAGKIFSADYLLEFSKTPENPPLKNANLDEKNFSKSSKINVNPPTENQITENQTPANLTLKNQISDAVKNLLSQDEIIFTNRNGKSKNIRPYIYSAEFINHTQTLKTEENNTIKINAEHSPTEEKESNSIIKINIDSTNLRAETVAAELEKLSDQRLKKITKTAQYVKIADQIIDVDEYLSSLYSPPINHKPL